MSAKYLNLESLLPPSPKRERAVVVEDAISFVGALQRKKAQLLKLRRVDLKWVASYNQSSWRKRVRFSAPLHGPLGAVTIVASQHITTKQRSAPENCTSDSPLSASLNGVVVRADPVNATGAGTLSSIHVHTGQQDVVVEMVWNKGGKQRESASSLTEEHAGRGKESEDAEVVLGLAQWNSSAIHRQQGKDSETK